MPPQGDDKLQSHEMLPPFLNGLEQMIAAGKGLPAQIVTNLVTAVDAWAAEPLNAPYAAEAAAKRAALLALAGSPPPVHKSDQGSPMSQPSSPVSSKKEWSEWSDWSEVSDQGMDSDTASDKSAPRHGRKAKAAAPNPSATKPPIPTATLGASRAATAAVGQGAAPTAIKQLDPSATLGAIPVAASAPAASATPSAAPAVAVLGDGGLSDIKAPPSPVLPKTGLPALAALRGGTCDDIKAPPATPLPHNKSPAVAVSGDGKGSCIEAPSGSALPATPAWAVAVLSGGDNSENMSKTPAPTPAFTFASPASTSKAVPDKKQKLFYVPPKKDARAGKDGAKDTASGKAQGSDGQGSKQKAAAVKPLLSWEEAHAVLFEVSQELSSLVHMLEVWKRKVKVQGGGHQTQQMTRQLSEMQQGLEMALMRLDSLLDQVAAAGDSLFDALEVHDMVVMLETIQYTQEEELLAAANQACALLVRLRVEEKPEKPAK